MKVYLIRTSEDGTVGVYSNKKKVFESIQNLINVGYENVRIYNTHEDQPKPTYQNICKELKDGWFLTLYGNGNTTITVETLIVNQ